MLHLPPPEVRNQMQQLFVSRRLPGPLWDANMLPMRPLQLWDCDVTKEVFTHEDEDDGTIRTFVVHALLAHVGLVKEALPDRYEANLTEVTLEGFDLDVHIATRSIDLDHCDAMTDERVNEPILMVIIRGKALVIDGNHRLAARMRRGLTTVPAVIVPDAIWDMFLIKDFCGFDPNELLK